MRAVRMYRELTGVIISIVIDTMRIASFEIDFAGSVGLEGMRAVHNKPQRLFRLSRCSRSRDLPANLSSLLPLINRQFILASRLKVPLRVGTTSIELRVDIDGSRWQPWGAPRLRPTSRFLHVQFQNQCFGPYEDDDVQRFPCARWKRRTLW